jgi:hypothetical protein
MKASELVVEPCQKIEARLFVMRHHSRLPQVQAGPWMYAFSASHPETREMYAAALWHNPSARTLPPEWLELRRMAVKDGSPHCTASSFLQQMVRQLRLLGHRHFISYQDLDVHVGTIYKAAGWSVEYTSKPRVRQRGYSAARDRDYRTSINGLAPDAAGKNRWSICYGCDSPSCTRRPQRMERVPS